MRLHNMRLGRVLTAAALLGCCNAACVSDRVVSTAPPLYPRYEGEPARQKAPAWVAAAGARPAYRTHERGDPSWYPRGGPISPRWTHIILHHSATQTGGAKTFDKYHRLTNGWDELGYHFVIGNGTDTPDGYVEVGPRWNKQKHGAHCKTPGNYYNDHAIGICLVGDFTRKRPTPAQLASLGRLLRFLSRECGIPPARITTHRAVTGHTQCPGQLFPLAAVRRATVSKHGRERR